MTTVGIIVFGYSRSKNEQKLMFDNASYNKNSVEDYDFPDKLYLDTTNGKISVFIRNKKNDTFIGYELVREQKGLDQNTNSSNYDIWRLSNASQYRVGRFSKLLHDFSLTNRGEWELAVQEKGSNDFVGGSAHGDEIMTSVDLKVDNEDVKIEDALKYQSVNNVEFVVSSDLYRDNTMTEEGKVEKIGTHTKKYSFTIEGLTLEQEVTFDESMNIDRSYLGMLPILRKDNGRQITDTAISNGDESERDVSEAGFQQELVNANEATIKSEENGVYAKVEILEKSLDTPSVFFVSNSESYNKLYFSYVEDGYSVNKGDTWAQTTRYTIETTK